MNQSRILNSLLFCAVLCVLSGCVTSIKGTSTPSHDGQFSSYHECFLDPTKTICAAYRNIRTLADTTGANTVDFFVVPHRGLWGLDPTIPENSFSAIEEAVTKGYQFVELDIARVSMPTTIDSNGRPDIDPAKLSQVQEFVASHDFVMSRLTRLHLPPENKANFLVNYTAEQLGTYRLTERDEGKLSNDNMMTLLGALRAAHKNKVALMIDTRPVKAHMKYNKNGQGVCVAFCQMTDGSVTYSIAYAENTRDVIDYAYNNPDGFDYRPYLVFKTPFPPDFMREFIGVASFEKVMWMPQANPTKLSWYVQNVLAKGSSYKADVQDLADFVDAWNQDPYRKTVVAFETAYKSGGHDIRIKPFTRQAKSTQGGYFSRGPSPFVGVNYNTMMGYIYKTTGYRSATFSGEPVGPRGLVNEYADWRMAPDVRADHLGIVDYDYAKTMVITTDRPDVWKNVQQVLQ